MFFFWLPLGEYLTLFCFAKPKVHLAIGLYIENVALFLFNFSVSSNSAKSHGEIKAVLVTTSVCFQILFF